MEVEQISLPVSLTTAKDCSSTTQIIVSTFTDDRQSSSSSHLVAPPIPVRAEISEKTFPKILKERRICPVKCESEKQQHELNGIVTSSSSDKKDHLLGPPLPPRVPLRRSVSLTHRPPPPPTRFFLQDNLTDSVNAPSQHQPLPPRAPTPPRTVNRTLARSAPLLNQVIPVSRWPLRERPTHIVTNRAVHVIPLTRWPLPESTGRLAMDCITKVNSGNEYVDSPTMLDRVRHTCQKNDRSAHPILHMIHPETEPISTMSANGNPTSDSIVRDPIPNPVEKTGLIPKLRRFMRRTKHNLDDQNGCNGRSVCQRCGRCSCSECTKTNVVWQCCGQEHGCTAESVVDVCSCMCCIRPIFYHCLKDENGEEDCSEEPCSCCARPHCALRWTIMALLIPCLPCLCLYLPLRCLLKSCRMCCGGPGCHCPRNLPPGVKGLLESESSSA